MPDLTFLPAGFFAFFLAAFLAAADFFLAALLVAAAFFVLAAFLAGVVAAKTFAFFLAMGATSVAAGHALPEVHVKGVRDVDPARGADFE